MGKPYRFRFRRERADGKSNESTSLKTFEKWMREVEPGDVFLVGWCRWVQCEGRGELDFGKDRIPRLVRIEEVEGEDNS